MTKVAEMRYRKLGGFKATGLQTKGDLRQAVSSRADQIGVKQPQLALEADTLFDSHGVS